MKKILFYIDTMYKGGAQRVMNNLLNHYAHNGYSVALINDFIQDKSIPQYPVDKNVKRLYLANDNSGNKFIKNVKRLLRLRRIVKDEKPDIILSFLGRPNIRMLLSTIGLKVKKYVSVRNDPNKEYGSSKLKKIITGRLFQLADGFIFQTEEAKEYFPISVQKKSKIILNPVDKKFFFAVRDNSKCNNIISAGRLEKQKNHKLLIDAFSIISNEISDDLIIYGDGPLRNELIDHIARKHLDDRIFLPGIVNDIEQKYLNAKIFVLSSDYEGLPNTLLEALAAGVPSISTDCPCGGPKTVIQNDVNGFLVPCNAPYVLAEKMKILLDDTKKRESFSTEAKKNAEAFNPDVILRAWDTFILK